MASNSPGNDRFPESNQSPGPASRPSSPFYTGHGSCTSHLQNYSRINFCCFKSPRQWHFVGTASLYRCFRVSEKHQQEASQPEHRREPDSRMLQPCPGLRLSFHVPELLPLVASQARFSNCFSAWNMQLRQRQKDSQPSIVRVLLGLMST